MPSVPMLSLPVTITDANKWIDLKEAGGAEESYSIATGVYADLFAVLDALDAAIGARVAGFTYSLFGDSDYLLKFSATGTIQFLWATGTHAASSLRTVFGFTAADTSAATTLSSDSPPPRVWCPQKPVRRDSRDKLTSVGGEFRRSEDGTVGKRLEVAQVNSRTIEFGLLAPRFIYTADATGHNLNMDWETIWEEIVAAASFRWRPSCLVPATYATYYWSGSPEWDRSCRRARDDVEYYDLTIEMAKDEG